MIFDSFEMQVLRERYRNLPDYKVPGIVFLDRYEGYAGERSRLEELILNVNEQKQKDWIQRLVSEVHAQYIGAWFEIMLFNWLLNYFKVTVEPEILGDHPDFMINTSDHEIAIEAKVLMRTQQEIRNREIRNDIIEELESIQKPFLVNVRFMKSGNDIDLRKFIEYVDRWIGTSADEPMKYSDSFGNVIEIISTPHPSCNHVLTACTESFWINPSDLQPSLKKKASQHKNIIGANVPYLLAYYPESSKFSAEEAVDAWFGRTVITYDVDSKRVVDEKCDRTGIIYKQREVRHKGVSGILVFKQAEDMVAKSRILRSWYIQNPYANMNIDVSEFPVEAKYIVVNRNAKAFEMKWVYERSSNRF